MPMYRARCVACSEQTDFFRKIADRDMLPNCSCGGVYERILTPTFISTDIEPYISPASGKIINSRVDRRNDLKAGGYIEWEPGIKEQVAKNRERNQRQIDSVVEKTVDELVTHMNVTGKLETSDAA